MRRLVTETIIAAAIFAGGVALGAGRHARRMHVSQATISQPPASPPNVRPKVKLDISDQNIYGVFLLPPRVLETAELTQCNRELAGKRLPLLIAGKRYIPVRVKIENVLCPDWHGYIDADAARLAYLEGLSG